MSRKFQGRKQEGKSGVIIGRVTAGKATLDMVPGRGPELVTLELT